MRNALFQIKEAIKALFSYPRETIDFVRSQDYDTYWKEKRGTSIGEISSWQQKRAEIILKILSSEKDSIQIADIGCGDGSILSYMKQHMPNITKCIGYDSSRFALERARTYGIETTVLDITEKKSYDALVDADYYLMLEVLEHIPHSEELMMHVLEKARKGIFFSFPNTGYARHRFRLLFGRFPMQWRVFPNEHVRYWTLSDLQWWLKALKIQKYTIITYKGVPILNNIFPSLFAAGFVVYIQK